MSDAALLNIVLYLPALGIALTALVQEERSVRGLSLALMVVQFLLAALLYARFDGTAAGLQFETRLPWIPDWGVYYLIGLDGYNVLLVLLTAFLGPLVVAGAFTAIQKDVRLFYAMVLLIQFCMLGTFVAQDLFLFYLFWEAMLIPMFVIIGMWGGERRIYATFKFVLYTAFGSILMLAAVIYLVYSLNESTGITSFAFADLYRSQLPVSVQTLLLIAFGLSFAIKVPMVPLHTWLPDAHVEAPTAGSVVLAGVLLKMGTYGFVRFALPLFPHAAQQATPAIQALAVIGIVYGSLVAMVQSDVKKLVAYSSVAHLGFVMLGIFAMNPQGLNGGVLQMVNHGLSTGALFLLVGMLYERRHTRQISDFGGIAKPMPVFAAFFGLVTMSSIGLPALNGFVGEFLILLGAFLSTPAMAILATSGVVLGAAYMLWMFRRMMFGPLESPENRGLIDLGLREKLVLAAIAVPIVWIGVYPETFLRRI